MKSRTAIAVFSALLTLVLLCGFDKQTPVVKATYVADIGKEAWSVEADESDGEGWYLNLTGLKQSRLLVEEDGSVFVADKLRVLKFDRKGEVMAEFRPPGPHADESAREFYADWFEHEIKRLESPGAHVRWAWERTEQDLELEYGDFGDLSGVYPLDDERLLVCKDENMQPRKAEYFILDRELNLLKNFTVDWPDETVSRSLMADGTGWMLAKWYVFLSREGGPMGTGVTETWIAPVDEDGAMGESRPLRPDCGLMWLAPCRKMLALYTRDFLTNEEKLALDWDKLEDEFFASADDIDQQDYETEWAVLDEHQQIEQPIRIAPRNHYKIDYITESRFGFILSGEGDEQYRDKAILITDQLMQPLCRIELPEKYTHGSIWRISIAGDWLAMDWQDMDVDEPDGIKLLKIDWPEELRPD